MMLDYFELCVLGFVFQTVCDEEEEGSLHLSWVCVIFTYS